MKRHYLFNQVVNAVAYETDSQGHIEKTKAPGGAVHLPSIDYIQTEKEMMKIVKDYLTQKNKEELQKEIIDMVELVKRGFILTHDGFRKTSVSDSNDIISLTVPEIYTFSVAVSYLIEIMYKDKVYSLANPEKVGICVIAPSRQDCGKNLIKMAWMGAGYEIVDLGTNKKPKELIKDIKSKKLDAIGISCMLRECVDKLNDFLSLLKEEKICIPVIIGGILANKLLAIELSEEYKMPVYYGQGLIDAEKVINIAISGEPSIDNSLITDKMHSGGNIEYSDFSKFQIHSIQIEDIIINEDARSGCSFCSGIKKEMCPLEIGFEKQKDIKSSKEFVGNYDFAFLVSTELINYENKKESKDIWLDLIKLEQEMEKRYGEAFAFRFPIACPFCRPKDCKLEKGYCTFNSFYRPLHETYCINITETLKNALNLDSFSGMYALILVR